MASPAPLSKEIPLFPLFALTWACASLLHQTASSFWMADWAGWLLVVAGFGVVFEPRCLVRFAVLIGTSLLHLCEKLPFVPNHILFEGMLHLAMLLVLGELAFSGKLGSARAIASRLAPRALPLAIATAFKALFLLAPFVPKHPGLGAATTLALAASLGWYVFATRPLDRLGEAFLANVSSVIRGSLVTLYLWAVVQKLNRDYLDPQVSCAAKMNEEIVAHFSFVHLPAGILEATILGTFAFELAIPAFLMFQRTRSLGFLAAVLFHLWLALHRAFGIYSFSSLVLAILVLFLPAASLASLEGLWRRQLAWLGRGDEARGRKVARSAAVASVLGVLAGQAACYLLIGRSLAVFWTANRIGFALFLAWGVWLSAGYLVALRRSRGQSRRLPCGPRPTWAWLGLFVVIINGICPWIGLKTQTAFSMYSNLRTEGDGNHLFLRRVDLFNHQADMVEFISSEPDLLAIGPRPRGIQQFANAGKIFPWFELRRLVSESRGDLRIVYRRGERLEASRIDGETSGDPELFKRHPALLSKLLWYRRHVSLEGPMPCTH